MKNSLLYETRFWSSQLTLPELDPEGWRMVLELPQLRRRQRSHGEVVQESVFSLEVDGDVSSVTAVDRKWC